MNDAKIHFPNLRVGLAGWQYADWSGTFYPEPKPRGFDALGFVSSYVNVIEVNSTFYRLPTPETCRKWADRTPPDFRFTVKAHNALTHGDPRAADVAAFRSATRPLFDEGKCIAVLLQFPWSFKPGQRAFDKLRTLRDRFSPLPLAIEVRHGDWIHDHGLEFLASLNTTVCGVDQPVIGNSIKPLWHIPGPAGTYVRFHGRNYKTWFGDTNRDDRYNYLYDRDELREWVQTLRESLTSGHQTTVIMNNHFRGKAPANAFELLSVLENRAVPAPETIVRTYPQLSDVTAVDRQDANDSPQQELF